MLAGHVSTRSEYTNLEHIPAETDCRGSSFVSSYSWSAGTWHFTHGRVHLFVTDLDTYHDHIHTPWLSAHGNSRSRFALPPEMGNWPRTRASVNWCRYEETRVKNWRDRRETRRVPARTFHEDQRKQTEPLFPIRVRIRRTHPLPAPAASALPTCTPYTRGLPSNSRESRPTLSPKPHLTLPTTRLHRLPRSFFHRPPSFHLFSLSCDPFNPRFPPPPYRAPPMRPARCHKPRSRGRLLLRVNLSRFFRLSRHADHPLVLFFIVSGRVALVFGYLYWLEPRKGSPSHASSLPTGLIHGKRLFAQLAEPIPTGSALRVLQFRIGTAVLCHH